MVKPMVLLSTKADRRAGSNFLALVGIFYWEVCTLSNVQHALLQLVHLPFYLSEFKRNVTANNCIIFNQGDSPFFHGLTICFRGAPPTDKGYV